MEKAKGLGATMVQEQFMTYYNWYMSVMRDPDGNAIRLACPDP